MKNLFALADTEQFCDGIVEDRYGNWQSTCGGPYHPPTREQWWTVNGPLLFAGVGIAIAVIIASVVLVIRLRKRKQKKHSR